MDVFNHCDANVHKAFLHYKNVFVFLCIAEPFSKPFEPNARLEVPTSTISTLSLPIATSIVHTPFVPSSLVSSTLRPMFHPSMLHPHPALTFRPPLMTSNLHGLYSQSSELNLFAGTDLFKLA